MHYQFSVGRVIMDVKQNRIEHVDEAWILKYRAAIKNAPPIEEPRFAKIIEALRAFRAKVMTHVHQVLLTMRKPSLVAAAKTTASPIAIAVRKPEQELKAS